MKSSHRYTLAALCVLFTTVLWLTKRREAPETARDPGGRLGEAAVSSAISRQGTEETLVAAKNAASAISAAVLPHAGDAVLASREVVNPENARLLRRTTVPANSLQITALPGGTMERVTYPVPLAPVRIYSRLRLETGP